MSTKNKDYYKKELLAIWQTGVQFGVNEDNEPIQCGDNLCLNCKFYNFDNIDESCQPKRLKWLDEECQKQLTNRIAYEKEILGIWEAGEQIAINKENGKIEVCNTFDCDKCALNREKGCVNTRIEWLESEKND